MEYDAAWPTLIGKSNFDSLEISQYILTNYDLANPPADKYGYNIFDDESTCMRNFQQVAYNAFDEYLQEAIGKSISDYGDYKMKAWITGHGGGYSMALHNHFGSYLSGCFYILAEEQDKGGALNLIDPRGNANRGYDPWWRDMFREKIIIPKTGDIVIFPSFLYHAVQPYYSNLRICVPVDLYLNRE